MEPQYCVTISFRGVETDDDLEGFVQLPEGAILTIQDKPCPPGFVAVSWQSHELWVFAQDLQDRAIAVDTPSNAA